MLAKLQKLQTSLLYNNYNNFKRILPNAQCAKLLDDEDRLINAIHKNQGWPKWEGETEDHFF